MLVVGTKCSATSILVSTMLTSFLMGLTSSTTVVVTFQEENYLVQGGCPSNEPEVQKYVTVALVAAVIPVDG